MHHKACIATRPNDGLLAHSMSLTFKLFETIEVEQHMLHAPRSINPGAHACKPDKLLAGQGGWHPCVPDHGLGRVHPRHSASPPANTCQVCDQHITLGVAACAHG